jgi:hypothetical protein
MCEKRTDSTLEISTAGFFEMEPPCNILVTEFGKCK